MLTLEKCTFTPTALSRYKMIDDTKAILKFEYKKDRRIHIVFKESKDKEDMLFFAIFADAGDQLYFWETGYLPSVQTIHQHLHEKYMSPKGGIYC